MNQGGRGLVVGALALLTVCAVTQADAGPRLRHCRHCRGPVFFDPFGGGIPTYPYPDGIPFNSLPAPDIEPQFVPGPSASPGPLPYPQGFVLDVLVRPRDDDAGDEPAKASAPLHRYREVADALAACWSPPPDFDNNPWHQVTLRVSFKRNGAINGIPRIPYVDRGLTQTARSDLTQSLAAALRRCTPLPLSPGLGAAIAGQIFALRFIEQEPER